MTVRDSNFVVCFQAKGTSQGGPGGSRVLSLVLELVVGMFGVMRAHPGGILGLLGAFFGLSWDPFGPSRCHLQPSWDHLDYLGTLVGRLGLSQNSCWTILDLSWACLGLSLVVWGPSWMGRLGLVWGRPGPVWGLSWADLRLTWAVLSGARQFHAFNIFHGPSWARFGLFRVCLWPSWAFLASLGLVSRRLGLVLGRSLGSSWLSWSCLGLVLGCLRASWAVLEARTQFWRAVSCFQLVLGAALGPKMWDPRITCFYVLSGD